MASPALVGSLVMCVSLPAVAACRAVDPLPAPAVDRAALVAAYELASVAALDVPYPADNPRDEERMELGRLLFFDPVLGGEDDVACATCHHPDLAFGDARERSVGVGGGGPDGRALGPARRAGHSALTGAPIGEAARNAPTVLNAALYGHLGIEPTYASGLFWDGRVDRGLEGQALEPVQARDEMAGDAYDSDRAVAALIVELREIEEYEQLFGAAFADEVPAGDGVSAIDLHRLERAIAAFERELVTPDAPFDRWLEGDDAALDDAATRGLAVFFGQGGCGECHRGPMLSDFDYHALGVAQTGPGRRTTPGEDFGRVAVSGAVGDVYAFRTPALRNVALTAPYMHDGAVAALSDAVAFFDRGGNDRGLPEGVLSQKIEPLGLSRQDRDDLVRFLESLTGTLPDVEFPDVVPSGLPPVRSLSSS
ncbi:MAG: cytochrome-c peroxidase [Anaerolineae bacterium]